MNALDLWLKFGAAVAVEIALLYLIAKVATRFIVSAHWQRTIWQAAIVSMCMACAGEVNGVRALIAPAPGSSPAVTVTIAPIDFQSAAAPEITEPPVAVEVAPVYAEPQQFAIAPVLRWCWMGGVLLLLLRMIVAILFTFAFRMAAERVTHAGLISCVELLRALLGLRRRVSLRQTGRVFAPFTFGVIRPVIVLPRRFTAMFNPDQQKLALLHELAHIGGFDAVWRLVANLLCVIFWWHPLVWMTRRELSHASEAAADEASLSVENGPARLAECLLECARQLRPAHRHLWIGMGGFHSSIGKRIERLMELSGPSRPVGRRASWTTRLAAPAVTVLLIWGVAAVIVPPAGRTSWRESLAATVWDSTAQAAPPASSNAINPVESAATPPRAATAPHHSPQRVEDFGVVISPRSVETVPLHTRFFKLDGTNFWLELEARFGEEVRGTGAHPGQDPATRVPLVKRYFSSLGIDLDEPGKAVFLNDRVGHLMVRATLEDLGAIETAIHPLLPGSAFETAPMNRATNDAAVTSPRLRGNPSSKERPTTSEISDSKNIQSKPAPGGTNAATDRPPTPEGAPQLYTRFFNVDPTTFAQGMSSIVTRDPKTGGIKQVMPERDFTNDINVRLLTFFKSVGADFDGAGKSILFNQKVGALMVRGTLPDLDAVERAVQFVNIAPPQLVIEVKASEVPLRAIREGFVKLPKLSEAARITAANSTSSNPPIRAAATVITRAQYSAVLRSIEDVAGADVLSVPPVTTLSGRQAQIKVVDVRYVVTDLDYQTNGAPTKSHSWWPFGRRRVGKGDIRPIAEPFEIGPIIDVVPRVEADGRTIQMTVLPTLREFLGYDDPGIFQAENGGTVSPTPLPKFRLRQVTASARVWDGQTLVIGAGQAPAKDGTPRELIFFITPRLIDAAGNPLHREDDLDEPAQATSTNGQWIKPVWKQGIGDWE